MAGYLYLAVLVGLMYLMLIRPQKQRLRAQRALLSTLEIGDEVLIAGGFFGRIVEMGNERVRLEISPGVRVETLLPFITRRVDPADPLDVGGSSPVEDV
ncbi:MAG TPA: preprotein translocase subunit YajC [Acidimicrobiales bacterium]|nr:preprotein translocase subunit YajC [Acidimicrobiales bacterium]